MAMDKNYRHLPAAVQVVTLVAVAATLAAGAFFFGVPGVLESAWRLSAQKDELETEVSSLQAENDFLEKFLRDRREYADRVRAVKHQLETLRSIIPEEQAAGKFKRMVDKDASAAGVHVRDLVALPLVAHDFYIEVPFQAHVEGRYHSVLMFFNRLEREQRIISIPSLSLRPPSSGKTSNYRIRPNEQVAANCVVTTYYVPAEPRAAPAAYPDSKIEHVGAR